MLTGRLEDYWQGGCSAVNEGGPRRPYIRVHKPTAKQYMPTNSGPQH